jgi:hypothetical protein
MNSVTDLNHFNKVLVWIVDDVKLCWYQCSVCNCNISYCRSHIKWLCVHAEVVV